MTSGAEGLAERGSIQEDVQVLESGKDFVGSPGQTASAAAKQVCSFFLRTGTCAYGDRCKFIHPANCAPPQLNSRGYPVRADEPLCAHYLKKGWCAFGMTCKFHHPELIGGSGMLLPAAAHAATMLAATQGNKVSGGNAPLVLSATNNPLVLAAAQQRHQLTGYLVSGPATLPAGVSTGGTTNYVVLAGPEYGGVQQGTHRYVIDSRQAGPGLMLGGYPGGISELEAAAGFEPQYVPILDGHTRLQQQVQVQIQDGTASAPVHTHSTATAAYLMQAAIAGGMLTAPAPTNTQGAQGTRIVLGSQNANDPGMSSLMAAATMTSAAVSSTLLGSSHSSLPGMVITTTGGPAGSGSSHNNNTPQGGGGPVMIPATIPVQSLNTLTVGSTGSVQGPGGSRGWVGQAAPAAPSLGPDAHHTGVAGSSPPTNSVGSSAASALMAHVAARQQQVLTGGQPQGLANFVAASSSRPGSHAPSVGSAEQLLQAMAELHLHQHQQPQQQQVQQQQQQQW